MDLLYRILILAVIAMNLYALGCIATPLRPKK